MAFDEAPSPTETRLNVAVKNLRTNRDPDKRSQLLNEFWNASTAWWRENMPAQELDIKLDEVPPTENHYLLNH